MKHRWRREQNGEIDTFAWEIGYCNGPVCEVCGRTVCEHCVPNWMDLDDCKGPRIITNADHIRSMTDEELAWEFMEFRSDAFGAAKGNEAALPNTQKKFWTGSSRRIRRQKHEKKIPLRAEIWAADGGRT